MSLGQRRALVIAGALAMAIAVVAVLVRRRSPLPGHVPPPIDADVSGCSAIVEGPVCEIARDRILRVWVRATPGSIRFATAHEPVASTAARDVGGGTLHRLTIPNGATELRVLAADGSSLRVLRLAEKTAPAWLEQAKTLRKNGDPDAALAAAQPAEASADVVKRAFALGLRARIELSNGQEDAAGADLREAARLHREAGRISDAADDGFALAFALNQRGHRYADARAVLDDIAPLLDRYPDGRARDAYYRGTLAMETGDARSALRLLREARAHAARLGLGVLERNALNAEALQLELVGRTREGLDLLSGLEAEASSAEDATSCERVEVAINIGFGELLALEQADDDAAPADDHATAPLERALALLDRGCTDSYLRTAALGNLALAALQRHDPTLARKRLDEARGQGSARAAELLFLADLDARIALEEGDPKRALRALEEEALLARAVGARDAEWRATTLRATALERLARTDEALSEYRAAETLLDGLGAAVPLGEGRARFVGDRSRSARSVVDLLVRLGRPAEALAAGRASRTRVLRGLAQRARVESFGPAERARWERALGVYRNARAELEAEATREWTLSRSDAARSRSARAVREAALRSALDEALAVLASELPAADAGASAEPRAAAGIVTILFHPVRHGWVGLVEGGGEPAASFAIAPLGPLDDRAALAEVLLAPIRARIDRAERLRILPYGDLRSVDFHALPYGGGPLVAALPIEYPLDLPAAPRATEGSGRALVIADPSLDLRRARAEREVVEHALAGAGGWSVDALEGTGATSAAVRPLLARAELFHYAGHGVFAGREGWQSALPLAEGGQLTIADILAAAAVPSRIVLSGCETARAAADAPLESLGLAQAFVVAGARFVIAPTRPVDDTLATAMATELYGELARPGVVDPAAAVRTAQLRLLAARPPVDWAAFRMIGR